MHEARAVVIATGVRDELPEVAGLAERWGTSVLHCPYCHGWEVRDRALGVLTTSPMSLHQAELVRQWSPDVTVFTAGLGALEPDVEARLTARGSRVVSSPVVEVLGEGSAVSGVRTQDGEIHAVEAIFTAGRLVPHDSFLDGLDLAREDSPVGSLLALDPTGRTSHPRVWAAGNVVAPMANVPMVMAAGAMAGAMVNAALVGQDTDAAVVLAG